MKKFLKIQSNSLKKSLTWKMKWMSWLAKRVSTTINNSKRLETLDSRHSWMIVNPHRSTSPLIRTRIWARGLRPRQMRKSTPRLNQLSDYFVTYMDVTLSWWPIRSILPKGCSTRHSSPLSQRSLYCKNWRLSVVLIKYRRCRQCSRIWRLARRR